MLLRDREMPAGEVAGRFDISRPAISRHLRILRECGLVVDDVRGRERWYRLDTAPLVALATEVYRTRRERRTSSTTLRHKSA